jgi:hypothetical protein
MFLNSRSPFLNSNSFAFSFSNINGTFFMNLYKSSQSIYDWSNSLNNYPILCRGWESYKKNAYIIIKSTGVNFTYKTSRAAIIRFKVNPILKITS